MPTIHEQIDELLAADVHGQLSPEVRQVLHAHLVECTKCRQVYKEQHMMNKMLQETFAEGSPATGLEQRMLTRFRNQVPNELKLGSFVFNLMRWRTLQIAAVAAALLGLAQLGRVLTHDEQFDAVDQFAAALGVPPAPATRSLAVAAAPQNLESLQKTAAKKEGPFEDRLASTMVTDEKAPASAAVAKLPGTAADNVVDVNGGHAAGPQLAMLAGEVKQSAQAQATGEAAQTNAPAPAPPANAPGDNRKLVRNAAVDLVVQSFDDALQKIIALAAEGRGYVATTNSDKLANGKLRGEVVVKVLPENLDWFLGKLRGLGELKNQSLTTEDVTKQYFDTSARLRNSQVMEQRLVEMLKTKNGKVSDLLQVEKELGRVRGQIEQMQGELKFMDAQVQFATVTIALSEKDMETPAGFLLKERAQLALYAPDVEKVFNEIKALASPTVQITNAQLDRDNAGQVSALIKMLIAPEESDAVIAKTRAMGRVANLQVQTERIARGGEGMSQQAKTERDKVELNITIAREGQEAALQQTSLNLRADDVSERTKQLRELVEKQGGSIRGSSFSRDPNGAETANVSLRVPLKNYSAVMQSLAQLGKLENISVHRDDRPDAQIDQNTAPADISIQFYSQGNIVSADTGLLATFRRTIARGAAALMWSFTMIGVAFAFLAPWLIALVVIVLVVRQFRRHRGSKPKN